MTSSQGISQVEGVNFSEIFSLVSRLTSIRLVMPLVATFYLKIEKMDVNTTFLHGYLEEEIYMKQPEGFIMKGKEELVYKLTRVSHSIISMC